MESPTMANYPTDFHGTGSSEWMPYGSPATTLLLSPYNCYQYEASSPSQSSLTSDYESIESYGPFGPIDSIMDEIATVENIDDILFANSEDDLYNLLQISEQSGLASQQHPYEFIHGHPQQPSSERKLSIDSSGYDSEELFSSSSSSSSSSSIDSPASSLSFESPEHPQPQQPSDPSVIKRRRNRKCKHSKEERALRKKDQNKRAAIKYREKKKFQCQSIETIINRLQNERNEWARQLFQLETELQIIVPLARTTFQSDPVRWVQLQQLLQRLRQVDDLSF